MAARTNRQGEVVWDLMAAWLVGKGLDSLFSAPTCDLCETNEACGETPCCDNYLCKARAIHNVKTGRFGGEKLVCPFCGKEHKL